MLKSCQYCGRIHDKKYDCGERPARKYKNYKRTEEEAGRYTNAWRKKSIEVKQLCHYLCEYCLRGGVIQYKGLEVHHIEPLRERPDLLLDDSNLVCLCRAHHEDAEAGRISREVLRDIAMERGEMDPPLVSGVKKQKPTQPTDSP